MDTSYPGKLVRRGVALLVVLCVISIVWANRWAIAIRWQEREFRREHSTAGFTERRVLASLPTASPEQVLEYYFWGLNNSSAKVVDACLTERCAGTRERAYKSPGTWRLSLIDEKSCNDGRWGYPKGSRWFTVRYRHGDEIVRMDYVLIREGPRRSWRIAQWGNG